MVNKTIFFNASGKPTEDPTKWKDYDAYAVEDVQTGSKTTEDQTNWKEFYICLFLLFIIALLCIGIGAIIYLLIRSYYRERRQNALILEAQIARQREWFADADSISLPSYTFTSVSGSYNDVVGQPEIMEATAPPLFDEEEPPNTKSEENPTRSTEL